MSYAQQSHMWYSVPLKYWFEFITHSLKVMSYAQQSHMWYSVPLTYIFEFITHSLKIMSYAQQSHMWYSVPLTYMFEFISHSFKVVSNAQQSHMYSVVPRTCKARSHLPLTLVYELCLSVIIPIFTLPDKVTLRPLKLYFYIPDVAEWSRTFDIRLSGGWCSRFN
jgi:hypothetical protein